MFEAQFPSRHRVKITVLKKTTFEDLPDKYLGSWKGTPCGQFEVGQEFVVSKEAPWEMPPGFCGWAWADIQKMVLGMARGGPNVFVSCCTDGYRPVLFGLEKLPD